ncbi:hypothetical protein [Sediminibacillus massiliensis]|nr:hypothetical protein [Sediminibacillus massiliensis]
MKIIAKVFLIVWIVAGMYGTSGDLTSIQTADDHLPLAHSMDQM